MYFMPSKTSSRRQTSSETCEKYASRVSSSRKGFSLAYDVMAVGLQTESNGLSHTWVQVEKKRRRQTVVTALEVWSVYGSLSS